MEYNDNLYSARTVKTNNFHKVLNLIKKKKFPEIFKKKEYQPINPSHPFNSQLINPNEISKKKNVHLLINDTIRDIIVKYNKEKDKKRNEKMKSHKYYYSKFKDEDKKYYLALKSILKKDFDNLPKFLSESKENKKKKMNLKINSSRNQNTILDKLTNKSLGYLTTSSQMKSFKKEDSNLGKTVRIFKYTDKNQKRKDFLINNYKTHNIDVKLKLIKKNKTPRQLNYIKNFKLRNINNLNIKKQLNFSITNMNSEKLGKISIFGVFEDIGIYGKTISSIIINYLIDYFEKGKEMMVCLEKNNFYSILHWSFVNAQKFLIKNERKFNINIYNSGCMGCILLIPNNNNCVIYCANSGKCKCILYTSRGNDKFCFESNIGRASERERIFNIIKNKKYGQLKNKKKEKNALKENYEKKDEDENNSKETNNEKENHKIEKKENNNSNHIEEEIKPKDEEKIDEEVYLKYFKELGVTRCFGNISGEVMGLSPDPEVTECDLRANKVKFAVLGNTVFWKYLDEKEVRSIVAKYLDNNDTAAATKELEELIKQKVGISSKVLLDSSFVVVYFDTIV